MKSAVIGAPHRDLGKIVMGIVVARPAGQTDVDQIMAAVRATLARFTHPRRPPEMQQLLRNRMAKVKKNVLRQALKDAFHAV